MIRPLALLSLGALLLAQVHAETKAPAKPEVKLPPGIKLERDISYIQGGDESQKLDLYLPEKPADHPLPLIVHIHGGGWRAGSKYPCPVALSVYKGYAVASVEYRFSQKAIFPAQIQDCQAAIRWLRAHSKEYNFDTTHVGVVGSSAGGHLSALVGTSGGKKAFAPIGGNEDQPDSVQAVCDYFGPADFTTVVQQAAEDKNARNIFKFNTPTDPYSCLTGANLDDKTKSEAVSPVHYVSKDSPPFLILHGTYDNLVPFAQSQELTAALKGKGVEAWLQPLPGAGHGGPGFNKPALLGLVGAFFDKYLKGTDAKIAVVPEDQAAVPPPGKPAAK